VDSPEKDEKTQEGALIMTQINVADIVKFEETGMTPDEEAKFFQKLINSGMVWKMQGSYGRRAMELIEEGRCVLGKKGHYDYYGNYVPSRYEVKSGIKGSLGYSKRMKKKLEELV
jgi:hypothetical protein